MQNLGHGANVDELALKYNINPDEIIDFSSNINPKVIDGLEKYILEGLKETKKYPDINYTNLRNNIGEYLDISPEYIIAGNGATEIIYLLMKNIKSRIAIFNPTFSEYIRAAKLNDLKIHRLHLDEKQGFTINIEDIKKDMDKFDSLFICNPNNPSGNVQRIKEILDLLKENNKLLIVDETFMEFVGDEDEYSLVKYIKEYDNLFIIKAVTKFFGMPGLRLGYGITSNSDLINRIYYHKEPWTINSFADNLSKYIFKDMKYIQESKQYYINERKYMLEQLKMIQTIIVNDTNSNFILIRLKKHKAKDIKNELLKNNKILIRDASNFIGLDNSYIRVAIKTREENDSLIKNLKILLGD